MTPRIPPVATIPTEPPPVACDRCDDLGFYIGDGNKTFVCDCGAALRRHVRDERRLSGIRPTHWDARTFSTYQPASKNAQEAAVRAQGWVAGLKKGQPCGLLMVGGTGGGKTHLAVAACRQAIEAGLRVRFTSFAAMMEGLRAEFSRPPQHDEPDTWSLIHRAHLVALDDIGAERDTAFTAEQLLMLLNHIEEEGKALIVTTNLGIQSGALGDAIGPRCFSRIMGLCELVNMTGIPDYRIHGKRG
jgi:DNA replication protein DnaC